MIIRAIRLRETGGFTKPQAVEDFSGGLDVLAGPNELGKSTLLKALQAALFEKHTSTSTRSEKALLRGLRPEGGGSPLIEVDFETAAGLWRLRKQFFAGKAASLSDLGKGQVIARGADAEEEGRRLLNGNFGDSSGGEAGPGVLWLGQTAALAPIKPDAGQHSMLRQAVEAEVRDTAGDGRSRELLRLVTEELDATVHKRGIRKGSAYANAINSRDTLKDELDQVSAQYASAEEQLSRLQGLTARADELGQNDRVQARRKAVEVTGKLLETSRKTGSELVNAQVVFDKYVAEQAASAKALVEYDAATTTFAAIEARLAKARPEQMDLLDKIQQSEQNAKAATKKTATLQTELAATGSRLKELALREAQAAAREKLEQVIEQRAQAHKSRDAIASFSAELDGFKVTPQLVDAARRESLDIAELEAQLGAGAPKVSISYLKGVSGAIRIDGAPAADGVVFAPVAPVQLEIEGVGTIIIEPGLGENGEDARADLAAHSEQLAVLFATMGIADLTTAGALLDERGELETRLVEARAQLSARAPDGLDQLDDEVDRLTQLAGGDDASVTSQATPGSAQSREELEQGLAKLEAARDEVVAVQARDAGILNDHRVELATVKTGVTRDGDQLEALSARMPPVIERAERRLALERHDEASIQQLNLARRNVNDLTAKAVSGERLGELEREFEQAVQAKQVADDELSALREEIRELTGGVNALAGEGVETRKVELADKLGRLQAAVERHESDVVALTLLRAELEQAGRATRDRFFGPILDNVAPYLNLVVQDSVLELGDSDDLQIAGLKRNGAIQSFDILSVGTREQIAVMVRLGFARLLANSGTSVPLILDDALVYSDDLRIARAFEALETASSLHQVIVLTCREAGFEALGGNRLKLVDWDVDATAV